jgi:hypothetical protein
MRFWKRKDFHGANLQKEKRVFVESICSENQAYLNKLMTINQFMDIDGRFVFYGTQDNIIMNLN